MQSNKTRSEPLRLFFALWPDRQVVDGLRRVALAQHAECGGRVMRAETLHITLLFLGAVQADRIRALKAAAAQVSFGAFSFYLSQFECWRHNRIGFVSGTAEETAQLSQLAGMLRQAVADAGFSFDQRGFVPHVTVLRKIEQVMRRGIQPPLEWRGRDFALVSSEKTEEGIRYRTLASWPLS